MITDERISQLTDRYSYLEHALGDPSGFANDEFVKLSREYAELGPGGKSHGYFGCAC